MTQDDRNFIKNLRVSAEGLRQAPTDYIDDVHARAVLTGIKYDLARLGDIILIGEIEREKRASDEAAKQPAECSCEAECSRCYICGEPIDDIPVTPDQWDEFEYLASRFTTQELDVAFDIIQAEVIKRAREGRL